MITDERVAKFIDTCRAMSDAGDGARYDWWDDLTTALVELQGLRARGGVPENARERMYYPIVMPLNADGQGPASEESGEIRKITWQVWDQFCDTFGDFDCLPDAIMEAERLNRAFYASPPAAIEQEQEPVAWQRVAPDGTIEITRSRSTAAGWDRSENLVRPLYLSPSVCEGKEEKPTHRHKNRGTEYALIGIGKMQAEGWIDDSKSHGGTSHDGPHITRYRETHPVDMREVAIYRSATDPTEIWVRPREEFEDGRFAALSQEGV